MSGPAWGLALLALVVIAGCSPVPYQSGSNVPRTRCLNEPGRTENYGQDRPLFYLLCVQTP